MLTTNLLPQEARNIIAREERQRAMRFFTIGTVMIFCIGSVLIASSYLSLAVVKKNLEDQLRVKKDNFGQRKLNEVLDDAAAVEGLLRDAEFFMQRPARAGALLDLFLAAAAGIRIDGVTIQQSGDVNLSGFAKTRRELLDFEKNLQDSGFLESVSFPIADIVRNTDINFSMRGKLKDTWRL